ncbi:hypothetical protein [Streptomyces sp. NPDC026673]|uniref:hypothetical protein n=1 Tax=Streptomyces sp. NPDC026673 TaxID=3155724 RepID=UPI00340B2F3B
MPSGSGGVMWRATSAAPSAFCGDGHVRRPVPPRRAAGSADRRSAQPRTPRTPAGLASLRATASDGRGGTVDQEIIRAFGPGQAQGHPGAEGVVMSTPSDPV